MKGSRDLNSLRLALVVLLSAMVLGCPRPHRPTGVLTTIPLHATIVRKLADEWVTVRSIYNPGENPFMTPDDLPSRVGEVSEIGVYISIGGPYDRAPVSYFNNLRPGVPVAAAYDTKGFRNDVYFVWTDPSEARDMVDIILDAILQLIPEHGEAMVQRAAELKKQYNAEFHRQALQGGALGKNTFLCISPSVYYPADRLHLRRAGNYATPMPGKKLTDAEFQSAVETMKAAQSPLFILYSRYDDLDDVARLARAANAHTLELLLFPEDLRPDASLLDMIQENARRASEADR
ncbi:MAG: metal ABC transporter solute-binding protein, Zn/Mn family [bacterium]